MTANKPPGSRSSEHRSDASESDPRSPGLRRAYARPRLEVLGDIRTLTLGATPGVGDSTPPNTQPF